MSNIDLSDGLISIGIDVGWSTRRRSCCLAVQGLELPQIGRDATVYNDAVPHVWAALFRLDELVTFISHSLLELLGDRLDRTTLIVDGPIGRVSRPNENRQVDSSCRRGTFYMRCQPVDVTGRLGQEYVDATYSILEPFRQASNNSSPWWGDEIPEKGFIYAETNPTVAMAMELEPQPIDSLPSRRRPIRTSEGTISAKSDWYWRMDVRESASKILGAPTIAQETHHEKVAGIHCLMLANLLQRGRTEQTNVVAIGGEDGIYVVSSRLHKGWRNEVDLLMVGGRPTYHGDESSSPKIEGFVERLDVNDNGEDEYGSEKSDDVILVLNDNGGVWQNHNGWLSGLPDPVCLSVPNVTNTVRLGFAAGDNGQWVIRPSALTIARQNGFLGNHLSTADTVAVDATLVDC